ncbi:hypothetical protein DSH65_15155 [Enterococcus faecalis]|uniref:Uncharacterized protein n=1 Tax=Enterococcus faecalis TaxID=1351 RepID=A0ABD7IVP0_ENTFL|nr:hypothetical protein [Enterococcus faecalis]EOD96433.1 hypothetical protein Q9E_00794 [Enterococcus faecalis EnGen0059]EOJ98337.1 hypothetical protein WOK_01934 [Enterococcus faecalis EnGen0359]EOK58525.1 hypothetical protein Q9C_01813 [Enterococcus faecalis EnGen0063]EGO8469869.1 hypothetical protein [Enterococcus faecalis]
MWFSKKYSCGALAKCAVDWAKNTFGVDISIAAFKSVLNTCGFARAAAWLAGKVASAAGRNIAAVLTLVYTEMTCAPIEAELISTRETGGFLTALEGLTTR